MPGVRKARRGDLAVVELVHSYDDRRGRSTWSEYAIGEVTSITRDGLVKKVREGNGGELEIDPPGTRVHVVECAELDGILQGRCGPGKGKAEVLARYLAHFGRQGSLDEAKALIIPWLGVAWSYVDTWPNGLGATLGNINVGVDGAVGVAEGKLIGKARGGLCPTVNVNDKAAVVARVRGAMLRYVEENGV